MYFHHGHRRAARSGSSDCRMTGALCLAPLGVRLGVSARGLERILVHYRPRKATYVRDAVDAASTKPMA
jgi:hypothetical protein